MSGILIEKIGNGYALREVTHNENGGIVFGPFARAKLALEIGSGYSYPSDSVVTVLSLTRQLLEIQEKESLPPETQTP